MRITDSCIDCLISRVALECSLVGADPITTQQTLASCRDLLLSLKEEPLSHPQIASRVHLHAYRLLNTSDPFRELKITGNAEATRVCREVRTGLSTFRDYVLASVIGNTFDYGVKGHTVTDDFSAFFRQEFAKGLVIDDTDRILPLTSRVVYLSDNCGEIVFDRLLIQYLKSRGSHITLAVKARPALNDATLEDTKMLGLDRMVDSLTTNCESAEIGLCPEEAPLALRDALARCTVVIAKGMANFESLFERCDLPPVAYLMAAKCQPVAHEAGVPVGSKIAMLRE
ncbi:damage-control phosphatase ARMT1 family protein [Methanoregula sp.]|uniref:damage-control phosphatase ARMT1 family protein n=1 Tax=Methanoregula sp. TaxID=2052170 RepID=UPI002BA17458|nr:ARMT1-like domain-containing protein [Methanoregula sp.]HVP97181.1 ARMT1-like domain-containing protein [Methanoregula sp.]